MSRKPVCPPKSILICSLRAIGDVILTTPLIGLLKDAWPEVEIDFLVNQKTGEFLEKDPRVRRVIYTRSREIEAGVRNPLTGYLSDIFRKYDMAINTNASDRGNLAVLLAGRHTRVGFFQGTGWRPSWKKCLLTHSIPFPFSIHVGRISQLVAEALGMKVSRLEAKVFWDRQDEIKVSKIMDERNIGGEFFLVHPFARYRYKYWNFDRFAEVSDTIAERYRLQPVWTSSPAPEEIALLHEAAGKCRRPPAVIAGEFSLSQMALILSRATFYLGLDTAVSHLAATTDTPMVVLYGPTIAERWSPWNNNGPVWQQCPAPRGRQQTGTTILLQKDLPCVPCGLAGCDDSGRDGNPCLDDIDAGEVLAAVDTLLGSRRISD